MASLALSLRHPIRFCVSLLRSDSRVPPPPANQSSLVVANFATMVAARAAANVPGSVPALRGLVLLENDPPAWPQRNCPAVFPPAVPPLPTPALLVGGALVSPKTDEVGGFFAAAEHARHADGHRPLPKDPKRCAALVEQIIAFLYRSVRDGL